MQLLVLDLPSESLVQICLSLPSLQEIHHLGLTCKRFYELLSDLGYHYLCRIFLCLSKKKKWPPAQSFSRSLHAADPFSWAIPPIAQSIADALDHLPSIANKRPTKYHMIMQGCRDWAARKEIFVAFLCIPDAKEAPKRLQSLCYWIERGEWDKRFTAISVGMLLRLACTDQAERNSACSMLSMLCDCLRYHGRPYDLSKIGESVRPWTSKTKFRQVQLIWNGRGSL